MTYEEYLATPEWKVRRDAALYRARYQCQLCCSVKDLAVHHRTYSRFGNEIAEDLTVLCGPCHERFHAGIKFPTAPEDVQLAIAEMDRMRREFREKP